MRYRTFCIPDDDDEIEDSYGFALDMDGILGASSPSRRVSFTTSSERDRPFVRPPQPVPSKPRTQTRTKKICIAAPALLRPENPRPRTPLGVPEPALSPETPRRPSTPVRPPEKDADDALPPSSPIESPLSSPLSSPAKDGGSPERDPARDLSLPPSSPIAIPCTPARDGHNGTEMEMDFMPSPPSPTLDALRITSRVSLRQLLNPMPEPEPVCARELSPEPITHTDASREASKALAMDGDITPLVLEEIDAEAEAPAVIDAADVILVHVRPRVACAVARADAVPPSSRASTPEHAMAQDIPSSPLSSPPRSVADEYDVARVLDLGDMDADMDMDDMDDLPPSSP
ncbi:hypothetical protein C2E23DRAFT_686635, partial [Lenzites betulinus]